jgi:large subunit ribosomal protein L31e
MAEEKIFTIPLRDVFKEQRTDRSKRASILVKEFLEKYMKVDKVKIGNSINEDIWKSGIRKPPRKLRIHVIKEDNIVYAELVGIEIKTPSSEDKKKKSKKKKEKKEKIKEERKERRKKTIQEELEEESGKSKKEEKVEEKKEEPVKEKKISEPGPK